MKSGENSINGLDTYSPALQEIVTRAERGQDDDWVFIDDHLPALANHPTTIQLARKIISLNGKASDNLLDLACSIFEQHKGSLHSEDHHKLRQIKKLHSHKPAGFRAACALYRHGERDEGVVHALRKASEGKDPVIKEHAKELLEEYNQEQKKKAT